MEFDSQLLQDILDFLRSLEDVQLPTMFQALRGTLMGRMRTALSSGDNYIDMKPVKPAVQESNITIPPPDHSSEEYVTSDQQPTSPRSFLYSQQEKKLASLNQTDSSSPSRPGNHLPQKPKDPGSSSSPPSSSLSTRVLQLPVIADYEEDMEIIKEEETVDSLIEDYSRMTLLEAEARSHIFGQLQRREKRFIFENLRSFWAVLVGSHFLSYDSRNDSKPPQILSIKGCTCRPVSIPQRNAKKLSDSTFELCFEDNRCYQYIASCPKEMEQWIAVIRRCEIKTRDTKNVNQSDNETSKTATDTSETEEPSRDSDFGEEYEDIVIPDIAHALANPARNLKPNMSPKPPRQSAKPKPAAATNEAKAKTDLQKTANHVRPPIQKLMKRDLPPPPPASQNDEDEMFYQSIVEPSCNQMCPNGSSGVNIKHSNSLNSGEEDDDESADKFYDDIATVKKEVEQIRKDENSRRETANNTPGKESAEETEETYDDVDVVKKEVELIKRNENRLKESVEVENQKKLSKEAPKVPVRTSPMKCFFGRFRQKSESPQKEEAKKKQTTSSPQQLAKAASPKEIHTDQGPTEKSDDFFSDQSDLSDYNSPPPPRPVHSDEHLTNGITDDEEEPIYDDIANRKVGFKDRIVISGRELEKGKKADDLVAKINSTSEERKVRPLPSIKPKSSVVRNLNEKFDAEIYQNQTGDGNPEDELEHYQVPRANANAQKSASFEDDDDSEKIYDDVAIVAQKKRENEQAKQKPVVHNAFKYSKGPQLVAKPTENFLNKVNKLSLSSGEKSSPEKKFQHRLNFGKKPKVQNVIIPLKNPQITADENEIYDDCQGKG